MRMAAVLGAPGQSRWLAVSAGRHALRTKHRWRRCTASWKKKPGLGSAACRSGCGHPWLASLSPAQSLCATPSAPYLHRPEAGLVSAEAGRWRGSAEAGCLRQAGVRSLALGGFLVPGRACGQFQAGQVYERALRHFAPWWKACSASNSARFPPRNNDDPSWPPATKGAKPPEQWVKRNERLLTIIRIRVLIGACTSACATPLPTMTSAARRPMACIPFSRIAGAHRLFRLLRLLRAGSSRHARQSCRTSRSFSGPPSRPDRAFRLRRRWIAQSHP
jgi:hypothetical protein